MVVIHRLRTVQTLVTYVHRQSISDVADYVARLSSPILDFPSKLSFNQCFTFFLPTSGWIESGAFTGSTSYDNTNSKQVNANKKNVGYSSVTWVRPKATNSQRQDVLSTARPMNNNTFSCNAKTHAGSNAPSQLLTKLWNQYDKEQVLVPRGKLFHSAGLAKLCEGACSNCL